MTSFSTILNQLVIRSDRHEGTLLELKFRDRLPSYLGRFLRRGQVIQASDLIDQLEAKLAEAAVDDFLRADVVASGTVEGRLARVLAIRECRSHNARMISRDFLLRAVSEGLRRSPAAAILGPRQCGKTTLARQFAAGWNGPAHVFDLEHPADEAALGNPLLALEPRSSNRRLHGDFSMCGGSDIDERASRFRNGLRGDVVA